jgi:hypothetical protein
MHAVIPGLAIGMAVKAALEGASKGLILCKSGSSSGLVQVSGGTRLF